MEHQAAVYPTVRCDSASTWTLRTSHPNTDCELMERLVVEHSLLRVHGLGFTYHMYGMRDALEAATRKWNERL